MKKIIIVLMAFILCSVAMHVQSIGKCIVEESDDYLYYKFELSYDNIRNIDNSLNNFEGSVKDILKFQDLLDEKLVFIINNKPVKLNLYRTNNDHRFLKIVYKSKKDSKVKTVKIENNGFLFFKDDHASFDFWLKLNDQKRLFKFNIHHKTIKAKY